MSAKDDVIKAWIDPGAHPSYHYQQISNLQRNWPTLYDAIVNLLKEEK